MRRNRGDDMRRLNGIHTRQDGAATLLVSMVLLIAATLLVLYASNTVVGEQRMSANEVRSKQAFEAAQAGIDLSVEHVNAGDGFDSAAVGGRWSSANSSYEVMFCTAGAFPAAQQCADLAAGGIAPACAAPAAGDTAAWVVGCGWSDDNAARKRVLSFVAKTSPLPTNVTNPLTAKGAVAMTGNPTVVNYFNNLTVWTGDTMTNTGNNGKTVIRRPSSAAGALTSSAVTTQVDNGNQVCNVNQAPDLICTTSSGVFGPDVIQGDTTLANLSGEEFFENFLGMPPSEYKSTVAEEIVAGSDAGTITEGGKVYWVDGDASISQNVGSEGNPVVLIVNGDLSLSGNATIFGVVFVLGCDAPSCLPGGNLNTSGGPLIRGAVLVTGSVSAGGSLNVIYDPDAVAGAKNLGTYVSMPGSWRDF